MGIYEQRFEIMKAKIKAVLFSQADNSGNYPLYIRIYFKGKSSYISTGYIIPSGAWNKEKASVWEAKPSLTKKLQESLSKEEIKAFKQRQKGIILLPQAAKINSDIRGISAKLEAIQNKLHVNQEEVSADILKRQYENKDKAENARRDFIQYISEISSRKHQQKQIRTAEKYEVLKRKLQAYQKNKPLPLDSLNTAFLNDFQLYLFREGSHQNYIHVNLKALRTIIQKEAIKEDRIIPPEKNPFLYFTMPKVLPTKKEKLDTADIERMEALDYPESDIHYHIRNAFLFSLYNAGIRIGDLLQLKWNNIKGERIEYHMGKTGSIRSMKLLPQAQRILKLYQSNKQNDSDYIFPFLDNAAVYAKLISPEDFRKASPDMLELLYSKLESRISMFNAGLKIIALNAKIKKKLTSHVARHSFADLARKKGISIYEIKELLGHSSISVTQGYLKSLDNESMDKAMKAVFS